MDTEEPDHNNSNIRQSALLLTTTRLLSEFQVGFADFWGSELRHKVFGRRTPFPLRLNPGGVGGRKLVAI